MSDLTYPNAKPTSCARTQKGYRRVDWFWLTPEQKVSLYHLKQQTGKPMTKLVQEAVDRFIADSQ